MQDKLKQVCEDFGIEGTYLSYEEITVGHVNRTYKVNYLAPDGCLYLEINEAFANETAAMLRQEGFGDVIIRNDIYGKARMIRAERKTHEETTD